MESVQGFLLGTVDYMSCIDNWCQCVEGESVYYRENGDAYCYEALLYDDCITDFDCLGKIGCYAYVLLNIIISLSILESKPWPAV